GLATPTEGGAMGMVGAIALAVLHHPKFSRRGRIAAWIALIAITAITLPAFVLWKDEWMPAALVAAASGFFSAVRVPLFIVFYTGLALLLGDAVATRELAAPIVTSSRSTLPITAMVFFIVIGSTFFPLVFRGVEGDPGIDPFFSGLRGGPGGFLIFVNL